MDYGIFELEFGNLRWYCIGIWIRITQLMRREERPIPRVRGKSGEVFNLATQKADIRRIRYHWRISKMQCNSKPNLKVRTSKCTWSTLRARFLLSQSLIHLSWAQTSLFVCRSDSHYLDWTLGDNSNSGSWVSLLSRCTARWPDPQQPKDPRRRRE
jgi:hypothetical protein